VIVIVDHGMGNLGSMANMFKKIGVPACVSADPAVVARADKLVLPGVGAFDAGMTNLEARGLIPVLRERVIGGQVPLLGVCLGMQLLCESSEEGSLPGLGWLRAGCVRFRPGKAGEPLKVPHMGWNTLAVRRPHRAFADADPDQRFYFVHSYYVVCEDADDVLAETRYGRPFVSAVARDNILGVQFHPEKSHTFGMALLRRFAGRGDGVAWSGYA